MKTPLVAFTMMDDVVNGVSEKICCDAIPFEAAVILVWLKFEIKYELNYTFTMKSINHVAD